MICVCFLSNSNLAVISGRRNHFCYGDVSLTTTMAGLAVRNLTASYMRLEKENREGVGDEGWWGREIGENDGEMKEERVSEERWKKCSSDGEKEDKISLICYYTSWEKDLDLEPLTIFLSSTMWSTPLTLTSPAMRMGRDRLTTRLGGPRPLKCGSSSRCV